MCPGACTCCKPTPLDKQWLIVALDAYAKASGVGSWAAWAAVPEDLDEAMLGGTYRVGTEVIHDLIAATISPLLEEIRRLTASPDPARYPSARELVDAWNRRTDDEQLALADQFLERQEHAIRCAMGRCTTMENDRG
jgi:hypothetical protein